MTIDDRRWTMDPYRLSSIVYRLSSAHCTLQQMTRCGLLIQFGRLAGGRLIVLDRHVVGRRATSLAGAIVLQPLDQLAQLIVELREPAHEGLLHILHRLALQRLAEHLATALLGMLYARAGLERFHRSLKLLGQLAHAARQVALKLL